MDLMGLHRVYREAYATFEALRRLGFSSDDIFFRINGPLPDGTNQVLITLRTQGREFNVSIGCVLLSPDQLEDTWSKLADAVASGNVPHTQLDQAWRESVPFAEPVPFVCALMAKGFRLPCRDKWNDDVEHPSNVC